MTYNSLVRLYVTQPCRCISAAICLLGAINASAAPATFTGLGDLPGGAFSSNGYALSANGRVVVGTGTSDVSFEAFRWTAETGIVGLGRLPVVEQDSFGFATSADGSVAVGHSGNVSGEAFRWTAAGGMIGMGVLPEFLLTIARGVSDDGSVVVGFAPTVTGTEAFRWTSDGGYVKLGQLPGWGGGQGGIPGEPESIALGVSGNGAVVVGYDTTDVGTEAYRWESGLGLVSLGDLPGGAVYSNARAASYDGSMIVGTGTSAAGSEAFYWTAAHGMVGLGDLPGGPATSWGADVTADGSVIVGTGSVEGGTRAFRWTAAGGMEDLQDLLVAAGANGLSGWTLTGASSVSADGRTFAGTGRNPAGNTEAWIATLAIPEPSGLLLALLAAVGLACPRRGNS